MTISMMSRVIAAAAIALLGVGTALAQDMGVENERGFYFGGGVGQFNVELDGLDGVDEAIEDLDADDTSWKAFVGYRLNPYISFEAAYLDFGRPNDEFTATGSSGDYTVELAGFAPYIVGTVPLGPVELSARAGYYIYDLETSVDIDDLGDDVFTSDDSGEDFVYGVGVGLTLFERLNARLEYEIIDLTGADADAFWLSGSWRF
jgi:hypothetical protein